MTGQPIVLVTRRPPGDAVERLADHCEVRLWEEDRPIPPGELRRRVGDVEGLYAMVTDPIDDELLEAAPRLRVVANMAVGVDNIDLQACTRRGIPVGHTPGVLNETVADTAMALLLAAARRVVEGADHVRAGRWGPFDPSLLLGDDVHDRVLGVIGLGRIGKAVARRARCFRMRILYHNRSRDPEGEAELGAEYRPLESLLAEADYVVLLCPLTEETHHLIDRSALARMKPTATLVNVARGPVVDTEALYEALRAGRIARAALDVTDPEPIPPDHPLVGLDNCLIIPHLGSASRATREEMAHLTAQNVLAGLRGETLPHCANPEVYEVAG